MKLDLIYDMYDIRSYDVWYGSMYDMGDECHLGNQSLMDIVNLKHFHNVLLPVDGVNGVILYQLIWL